MAHSFDNRHSKAGHPGHGELDLLQRGARELIRLRKQLAAARAELELLELESAMQQAMEGDPSELATWLARHSESSATAETRPSDEVSDGFSTSASGPNSGENVRWVPAAASKASFGYRLLDLPFSSWDEVVPYSLARLAETTSETSRTVDATDEEEGEKQVEQRDLAGDQEPARRAVRPEDGTNQTQVSTAAGSPQAAPDRKLPELVVGLKVEPDAVAATHRRLLTRAKVRGTIASIAFHLMLFVLLALVTLKTTPPPAGMSFEAAPVEQDEMEVVELPEMPETELEPIEEVFEPTPSPPAELVDMRSELDSLLPAEPISKVESSLATSGLPAGQSLAVTSNAIASAPSAVQFFGAAAGGNRFCYVIDGSGSMRGGPWQAAKAELIRSLHSLKPDQRFYIIFFNRKLQAIPEPGQREPAEHLLYATRENVEHARRWLETLQIDIGAPPNDALELAISLDPDAIYLLTDGVTKVDVAGFLRKVNRVSDIIYGEQVRVPIHTIAFYSEQGIGLLRQIAAENQGQFVYVPDPRTRK